MTRAGLGLGAARARQLRRLPAARGARGADRADASGGGSADARLSRAERQAAAAHGALPRRPADCRRGGGLFRGHRRTGFMSGAPGRAPRFPRAGFRRRRRAVPGDALSLGRPDVRGDRLLGPRPDSARPQRGSQRPATATCRKRRSAPPYRLTGVANGAISSSGKAMSGIMRDAGDAAPRQWPAHEGRERAAARRRAPASPQAAAGRGGRETGALGRRVAGTGKALRGAATSAADAKRAEPRIETRQATAAVEQLLRAAGPGRDGVGIDVEVERRAVLAIGRAGRELDAVGHDDLDHMIVGMDVGLHRDVSATKTMSRPQIRRPLMAGGPIMLEPRRCNSGSAAIGRGRLP